MTIKQVQRIQQLYLEGKNAEYIGKEMNVSVSTVYRCLRPVIKNKRINEIADELTEDYLSGNYSCEAICKKYHVTRSTMYNYLADTGHMMRCKPMKLNVKMTRAEAEYILSRIDESQPKGLANKLERIAAFCR